jgi:hypothetical protein
MNINISNYGAKLKIGITELRNKMKLLFRSFLLFCVNCVVLPLICHGVEVNSFHFSYYYESSFLTSFPLLSLSSSSSLDLYDCFFHLINITQNCHNRVHQYYLTPLGVAQGFASEFSYNYLFLFIHSLNKGAKHIETSFSSRKWEYNCNEKKGWNCYLSSPSCPSLETSDKVMEVEKEDPFQRKTFDSFLSSEKLFFTFLEYDGSFHTNHLQTTREFSRNIQELLTHFQSNFHSKIIKRLKNPQQSSSLSSLDLPYSSSAFVSSLEKFCHFDKFLSFFSSEKEAEIDFLSFFTKYLFQYNVPTIIKINDLLKNDFSAFLVLFKDLSPFHSSTSNQQQPQQPSRQHHQHDQHEHPHVRRSLINSFIPEQANENRTHLLDYHRRLQSSQNNHKNLVDYVGLHLRTTDKKYEMSEEDWNYMTNAKSLLSTIQPYLYPSTNITTLFIATDNCSLACEMRSLLLSSSQKEGASTSQYQIVGACFSRKICEQGKAASDSHNDEEYRIHNPRDYETSATLARETLNYQLLLELYLLEKSTIFFGLKASNIPRLIASLRYSHSYPLIAKKNENHGNSNTVFFNDHP